MLAVCVELSERTSNNDIDRASSGVANEIGISPGMFERLSPMCDDRAAGGLDGDVIRVVSGPCRLNGTGAHAWPHLTDWMSSKLTRSFRTGTNGPHHRITCRFVDIECRPTTD